MPKLLTQGPPFEVTRDLDKATVEDAWQWLLNLRDAPVVDRQRTVPLSPCAQHTLTVLANGEWCSNAALSPAASGMLDLYAPVCAPTAQPFVVAQMGQSLDGRIATQCGISHYINGRDGLVHLHRLRALVDAVVIGSGTATVDNPRLTVRHVPGPDPVRVILDRWCRVPNSHNVFNDGCALTLRLVNPACKTPPFPAKHLQYVAVAMPDSDSSGDAPDVTVQGVLAALANRGLTRVLIEGGGLTVSRFLAAGALDRLHVIVAPMIIGSGRPAFTLPTMDTLEHALRPVNRRFDLGTDLLFDLKPKQHPKPGQA